MAREAESCPECRALVASNNLAAHLAWHTGLTAAVANHPHPQVTAATLANHPHGPVAAR